MKSLKEISTLFLLLIPLIVCATDLQMQSDFLGDNQLMKPPIGDLQLGHILQGIIEIINAFDEELFSIIYFVFLLFFLKRQDFLDKEQKELYTNSSLS